MNSQNGNNMDNTGDGSLGEIRKLIDDLVPQDSWDTELLATIAPDKPGETQVATVFLDTPNQEMADSFNKLLKLGVINWGGTGGPRISDPTALDFDKSSFLLQMILKKGDEFRERQVTALVSIRIPLSGGSRKDAIGLAADLVFEDDESRDAFDILLKRDNVISNFGASGPAPGAG